MKPPSMEFMPLVNELRGLIEQARQHVAQTANSTLTLLHWKLGARIQGEILQGARASYGEEILPTLSAKLLPSYGRGFSTRNLARMIQFAEAFPDEQIVSTVSTQFDDIWAHVPRCSPSRELSRHCRAN